MEGDDFEGSNPTKFGTAVHDVAERVHNLYMRGEEIPPIMDLFDEEWRKSTCYDPEYYGLGHEKLEAFIERTIYERRGDTIATELAFVLNLNTMEVHLVDDYDAAKSVVKKILAAGHVPARSKIDRVDRIDGTTFEVYDYKTNILPFTRDEVENSIQLGLYDMVIRALYPEAETVVCVFDMLRHGRFPTIFGAEQRDSMRRYLINLWHQIKNTESLEERINRYCRWCEIRSTCGAYRRELTSELPVITTEADDSAEALYQIWQEYRGLADKAKLIEERQNELKEMLAPRVVENGGKGIKISKDQEIYLSPNPRYEYPMMEVWEVLKKNDAIIALRDVANIGKGNMDRFLKSRPELKEQIDPLLQTKHAKPTIRARRVGSKATSDDGE